MPRFFLQGYLSRYQNTKMPRFSLQGYLSRVGQLRGISHQFSPSLAALQYQIVAYKNSCSFGCLYIPVAKFATSKTKYDEPVAVYKFGKPPTPKRKKDDFSGSTSLVSLAETNPDKLEALNRIYLAEGTQEILEVFDNFKPQMSEIHISRAIWRLSEEKMKMRQQNDIATSQSLELVKQDDFESSLTVANPTFKELCESCLRHSIHMDDSSFLFSLKALLELGIPSNSVLVNTLLTQAGNRINRFSAANVALLMQILRSLEVTTEISEALNEAIYLIIPRLIEHMYEPWELIQCLHGAGHKLSIRSRNVMVNRLIAIVDAHQSIFPYHCFQIVMGLEKMDYRSQDLLDIVSHHLCSSKDQESSNSNFSQLGNFQIARMFRAFHRLQYQNLNLFETMCEHVSKNIDLLNNSHLAMLCEALTKLQFVSEPVLNTVCSKWINTLGDENALNENQIQLLASFLNYLTSTNLSSKVMEEFIQSSLQKLERTVDAGDVEFSQSNLFILSAVCAFAVCGQFSNHLIQYAWSSNIKDWENRWIHQGGRKSQELLQKLSLLHQLLQIHQPEGIDSLNPSLQDLEGRGFTLRNPWIQTQSYDTRKEKTVLEKILKLSFETVSYETNVKLPGGLLIDFLLDLSEGSELSKKCAVNVAPFEAFPINHHDFLFGSFLLKDNVLQKLGYQTVWVRADELNQEHYHRAELHLLEEIKG